MKLVIIGGVAAGATAAARARRIDEKADIIILEKGPYVSFANCGLPYRVSGDIPKRGRLILQTAEGFFARYRVNVMLNTEAVGIDRQKKKVRIKGSGGESDLPYDKLILAQGGSPFLQAHKKPGPLADPRAGGKSPEAADRWSGQPQCIQTLDHSRHR